MGVSSRGVASYLDGVFSLREMRLALLRLLQGLGLLLGRQTATDSTGLLRAKVEGKVLLVLVEEAKLGPLLKVDDGQGAGDGLAQVVAIMRGGRSVFQVSSCLHFLFFFPIPSASLIGPEKTWDFFLGKEYGGRTSGIG